jgi:hypothetical protein
MHFIINSIFSKVQDFYKTTLQRITGKILITVLLNFTEIQKEHLSNCLKDTGFIEISYSSAIYFYKLSIELE